MLERLEEIGKLFDYYSNLLNTKHKEVLELYYFQDMSLGEISEILNVTRQGVFDLLKRAENNLQLYEKNLGLIEKNKRIMADLESVRDRLINDVDGKEALISDIEKIIESM
ncbi:MAG: sigma factor-like helix-turn-helix DNA-binding protein [Eubacteriales bacterium]|nr:sigma factor-like helix-turn-helix DNA-binding protein [Eubacteriales bacterium]